MGNELQVTTERVDDLPVLLEQAQEIELAELLDQHFHPHGNWQGTSLGWTATIWLSHILSAGDHRLNQVEEWVQGHVRTLSQVSGQQLRPPEWSDDRLEIVLDELAEPKAWQALERDLTRRSLRVYDLSPRRVRLDSTTVSGYWTVSEDGLFQFGHSKDHRPDLPQLKVMLSALDPLGLPLLTQVVSGQRSDDPLYLPAIQQVQASLEQHGLLYVGDCKMGALGTRAYLHKQEDYYLCPLAGKQMPPATWQSYLQPVWQGKQELQPLYRTNAAGQEEQIAEGYEQECSLSAELDGELLTWSERRLIVRSLQEAQTAGEALERRLKQAEDELLRFNEHRRGKKHYREAASLQAAADKVLAAQQVTGLLQMQVITQGAEVVLHVERDAAAIQGVVDGLGWRVYATNQPAEALPLQAALLAYREEYLIERGFGRLKGRPLSLRPMYLQSDRRATGLIHLLSLGLRLLSLIEHRVRLRLAERQESLAGLYAGNPKRATARPTAEAMLAAFKGIHLSVVQLGEQVLAHVTPLSEIQEQILSLLGFSPGIYTRLVSGFPKPAGKMTEP